MVWYRMDIETSRRPQVASMSGNIAEWTGPGPEKRHKTRKHAEQEQEKEKQKEARIGPTLYW